MDWLTKIRLKYRQESKCKSIYMCWCCYICWYIRIKSTGSIQGRISQWGRVWGLKTKHPKSFQLISSWKPQHPKSCLLSKELNPNVDKKIQKKKNQKQRMNVPVRKSLRVEGLENRRPSILICATCVCVHRSTMIFVVFVFVLLCFCVKNISSTV